MQSAVSYQVRKLESQLGLQLVDREGYRVRLTPAGEAVLAEGQRLLAQADHVEAVARQFTTGWVPRLTVILDGIRPLEPTLSALKKLADERVPTRIQMKVEFLRGAQYRFDKDDADPMLVKDYEAQPNLQVEALADVECVLCVAAAHPLAAIRSASLSDLHEHVELSVQDSSGQGDDRHMFGGERVFYMSGFVPKKQALLLGLGFGWMPRYLVSAELREGRVARTALRQRLEVPIHASAGASYRSATWTHGYSPCNVAKGASAYASLLTGSPHAKLRPVDRKVRRRSRRHLANL